MRYEGTVYRPPSEAGSLIIQFTIGCARNTCTFCNMYKDKTFRIRPLADVEEDLEMARKYYSHIKVRRIFLADGDALIVKTEDSRRLVDSCCAFVETSTKTNAQIHALYLMGICWNSFELPLVC